MSRIASILMDGVDVDKPALRAYLAAREVLNAQDSPYNTVGDLLADDTVGLQAFAADCDSLDVAGFVPPGSSLIRSTGASLQPTISRRTSGC